MPSPLLALDIAILLPPETSTSVELLNTQLSAPPEGFRFSARRLPHISLVQQFSPTTELNVIEQTIAGVVSKHPPIDLTVASITTSETTSSLTVTPSPVLDTLHRRLMDQLAIFDVGLGDERAFINTDATPTDAARLRDITWVSQFRTDAAYDAFAPHVTLGVGAIKTTIPKTTFTASVIALCILGRFCTCQKVLASWELSTH